MTTRDEKIADFISYARTTEEVAVSWLERFDWDVEVAKHRYWIDVVIPYEYEYTD